MTADPVRRALGPVVPAGRGAGHAGRRRRSAARSPGWSPAGPTPLGGAGRALRVVAAFFCLSGVVVAWAGRIDDTFTLPAALGMFFVKALVLFALLERAAARTGWLDRRTLAFAVVAGALLWSASSSGGSGRGSSTTSRHPPRPPSSRAVAMDQERPEQRG